MKTSRFISMTRMLSFCAFCFFITTQCTRPSIREASEAMRLTKAPSVINDDLPLDSFIEGIKTHIAFFENSTSYENFTFGPRTLTKAEYLKGLKKLIALYETQTDKELFLKSLPLYFDFYEIYGKEKWGQVFLTSYYEPVIQGSLTPTEKLSQPLYSTPSDLVEMNLKDFATGRPELEEFLNSRKGSYMLRGRIDSNKKSFLPYYTRADIDGSGVLKKPDNILCFVDPIEAFFLQIQGSGRIILPDQTEIQLTYANQNGHPYVAIGKHMTNLIPLEKMTLPTMEAALKTLSPSALQELLNNNPSYVFFNKTDAPNGSTALGTQVIAGRTVATDMRYFPKGGIGLLMFPKPIFETPQDIEPKEWKNISRLVIDQDTGGAIKGPHRLDLFAGRGPEAKQSAGIMKHWGSLYYLVPNEKTLNE